MGYRCTCKTEQHTSYYAAGSFFFFSRFLYFRDYTRYLVPNLIGRQTEWQYKGFPGDLCRCLGRRFQTVLLRRFVFASVKLQIRVFFNALATPL